VTGTIEKPEIALLSDQLRQEDILSLLTIGVTSDINKNLDPTERNSIQRIQFGSLLLNQTKLNEDINNTIGVNVSVLPEFESEETNLVESGKAGASSSASSKIKSTTKIKINKKITPKLDVGVSSTVGGSIEQTQQMNANYNINKNLSVEGVYEVKPSEDESTTTPTSYGVDLKWKWSF
jgi:translocation and assembly module TamB